VVNKDEFRIEKRKILTQISRGAVYIHPTDTIYGFHCASTRLDAVEKIRRLKMRGRRTGFILLASDLRMVDGMVESWPGESRKLLACIWPASLTAILPASERIPRILSLRGKVAVRVPDLKELRMLIRAVGEPIVSTSVNVTGTRALTRINDIKEAFPGIDAYVSQRGRPSSSPSTVVDFTVFPPCPIRIGSCH